MIFSFRATVEMQRIFRETTGLDILESITIASACMRYFRTFHLGNSQLPIIPEVGYEPNANQSTLARKFLKFYAQKYGVEVQDCDSKDGEVRCGPYSLDGYVATTDLEKRSLAIEVHGSVS